MHGKLSFEGKGKSLGGRLEKRLAAYATAAGAAAVGLLTTARPAKADIVFTSVHTTLTSGELFVEGYPSGSSYPPFALRAGARIGSRDIFWQHEAPAANVAASFGTVISGPFPNVGNRFLGLRFDINGQVHFGWAELNVRAGKQGGSPHINATLLGFAYDTVAGQSLLAGETGPLDVSGPPTPEPGTLGLLALGSLGLGFWRRRKAVASSQ
ncbi:MAG TPA: PEP-CTERM sorting domain-containing protein [Terriglobia bacterium]|nr:PEP-CTERM sorting domain-containing protein [Terriglobia bacterium]